MVNKLFRHISDFVLASYTVGCVKMSYFVLNNRHLREVLIFFFHSKKTATEAHRKLKEVYGDAALSGTTCRDCFRRFKDGDFEVDDHPREGRYRTQLMRLSRALREKRTQYEQRHEPTWKRSNGKSYPNCRIPQILRRPIITCSGR